MTETIVFPDLVASAIPYLQQRMGVRGYSGLFISNSIPNPRPDLLVILTVAGGTRLNIVQRQARLLVECWAPSHPKASALAEVISQELETAARSGTPLTPGVWVGADPEDFTVPVNNPDPDSASPRYQFYANLILRGFALS